VLSCRDEIADSGIAIQFEETGFEEIAAETKRMEGNETLSGRAGTQISARLQQSIS